jgi:site-specific recombinase XerD
MSKPKKPKAEWESEPYVIEWLNKVSERTQKNYRERFPKWLRFINMTPTEQFKKRIKDLQSENPKERGFFEDKTVEFKNLLITQNLKAASVMCTLTPVLSFFSAHRVPLRFKRKELKVEERKEDKVITEWIPENSQVKQIYQHGTVRDRAILLTLYQSGFSETDVSCLSIEDLPNIYTCDTAHYPITLHRDKTGVLQRTCLSEEAVHDIKAMLTERQNPTKGALFISQKGERLTTRFINDIIKTMVEKTYGTEQTEKFKTKSLRDAYNDALLRANLTQEIKDTLFGHTRQGAKEKYAISQTTILDAYNKAFQFLSVNHGTQSRKDFEVLNTEFHEMQEDNKATVKNLNNRIAYLERKLNDNGLTVDKMLTSMKDLTSEVKALRREPEKVKIEG